MVVSPTDVDSSIVDDATNVEDGATTVLHPTDTNGLDVVYTDVSVVTNEVVVDIITVVTVTTFVVVTGILV